MGFVGNSQTFFSGASGILNKTDMADKFELLNDAVLVAGRDITVHLKPSRSNCTDANCKYNSFYKSYIGVNNQICEACRGQGFVIEPRWTIYRANIRWTNRAFDDGGGRLQEPTSEGFGKIGVDFVRTKTDISSFSDLRDSIGATIDDEQVELIQEPRKTGFSGRLMNVVTWWRKINR